VGTGGRAARLLGRARLGGETFDLPGGKVKVPLTARMRVRLHRSRVTFGVNWPLAALLVAVAGVYVLARVALDAAGAPAPSTLAGLLMAGAYAVGLPLAQRMTARRLVAAS
jgi:hypothetical protein